MKVQTDPEVVDRFIAQWPAAPSDIVDAVYSWVICSFKDQGTTLTTWARHQGASGRDVTNVRAAFHGRWKGYIARQCVMDALRDSGVLK